MRGRDVPLRVPPASTATTTMDFGRQEYKAVPPEEVGSEEAGGGVGGVAGPGDWTGLF